MDKKIVSLINFLPERNRFIRGLRNWVGPKSVVVMYTRDKRFAGKTKYSIAKLFRLAFDGIVSVSGVPLKISLSLGFIISLFSIIYSVYIVWCKIFAHYDRIPGWASLVVAVTFLGGIQLMVLGFMGEYIIRISDEVKARPLYILRSSLGFDSYGKDLGNRACP
jgi:polyisoprenyl-phosphate glycosyltransferase